VKVPARGGAPPASNIDLVQAAIDAYNDRDAQALRRVMTPEVELRPPSTFLRGRAYRGYEGIVEWLADVEESFKDSRVDAAELRDLGDFVLALTSFRVHGSRSRMELESELGVICRIEGGRIASWQGFSSHADALAAIRVGRRPPVSRRGRGRA
jgi:ketosteroid isomerase-like protein